MTDRPSHPPTIPTEIKLPSPIDSDAPDIILQLPSDPGLPADFREMPTLEPGPFEPSKEPEDPIVAAVRNAVRQELEQLEQVRVQFELINDPDLGVLGVLRSLEEPLQNYARDMAAFSGKANKMFDMASRMFNQLEQVSLALKTHAADDDDRFAEHERRIRELERQESDRRIRELEQWRVLVAGQLKPDEGGT